MEKMGGEGTEGKKYHGWQAKVCRRLQVSQYTNVFSIVLNFESQQEGESNM